MGNSIKTSLKELKRLEALHSYNLINDDSDDFLDKITALASNLCDTPVSFISMIDEDDQWFVSRFGMHLKSTKRSLSFCTHTIEQEDIVEIYDTLENPTFSTNPLVTGNLNVRFYAGIPLKDPNGFNIGTLCVFDSVPRKLSDTQRSSLKILAKSAIDFIVLQKSQRDLQSSHIQLNTFFDLSPDFLCTASFEGYFKKVSTAFIKELGYSEKELLEIPFLDFVHEEDKSKTLEVMKTLDRKSEKVFFFRNRYRCKNGSYLWLSWNAIPNAEANLIFATARNVSKLMQLEEELEKGRNIELKLNNEKYSQLCELTLKISHEILNPINLVIGYADVTLNLLKNFYEIETEEEGEEIFNDIIADQKKIIEHGRYIFNIIHRMNFDIDHEYAPTMFHKSLTDHEHEINALCSEFTTIAYSNFLSRVKGFKCDFEEQFDETSPKVKISITDFGEAVLNILYNAFEATIEKQSGDLLFKPKVSVSTLCNNGNVEIRIANNGVSIQRENISKILNPFFTTKAGRKAKGLGLTASFGIIKKNGGAFLLEKSDQQETVFLITLPVTSAELR